MKATLSIGEIRVNPFFFSKPNIKRRMLMKPRHILVLIAAWVIAASFIIIPRFLTVLPVNTTLGDVVNGINGLQTAIYTAMGIEIGVVLTAMVVLLSVVGKERS